MIANDAYTMACNAAPPGSGNCPAAGGLDVDFGSSAMLLTLANGRRALVAGRKSGVVHAIDSTEPPSVRSRTGSAERVGGERCAGGEGSRARR
jgi:polyvinyl alcohol dehydrogenase (cytochrome)